MICHEFMLSLYATRGRKNHQKCNLKYLLEEENYMISLTCPSCSGELELPDDLVEAHCLYCGTRILLQEHDIPREKINIARYIELSKVALDAENYEEALEYSSKILEIDTQNLEAWTTKAISTFWQSTRANNLYDEAISYLDKAASINPKDVRISEVQEQLTRHQTFWLTKLGNDKLESANKTYALWYNDCFKELSRSLISAGKSRLTDSKIYL